MTDFFKVLNDLSTIPAFDTKEYDLENMSDKDYEELKGTINELKNNPLFGIIGSLFGIDNDTVDSLLETVDKYRKEKEAEKNEPKFKRPSETISTDTGLQIHKLVQEYIDTMIKPYNPKVGGLSNQAINDAYAGLYEYSCWLIQHK